MEDLIQFEVQNFFKLRVFFYFVSFGREEVSEREKREDERNQLPRVSRPDRKLPDLRDKLKRRGLLRRTRHDDTKDEKSKEVRSKKEENGSSKVSKKIYVKPNVVLNDSSINKPHEKPKAELPRAFTDRLTVRRLVCCQIPFAYSRLFCVYQNCLLCR